MRGHCSARGGFILIGFILIGFIGSGLFRFKVERGAIHAVAQARGFRSIGEDMAQMPAAIGALNFRAHRKPRAVLGGFHGIGTERLIEARPTGARLKFGFGWKQLLATAGTGEYALSLFGVQRAGTGALGSVLAQHAICFGAEALAPFRIGLFDFAHVWLTFPRSNVGDQAAKGKLWLCSKLRVR